MRLAWRWVPLAILVTATTAGALAQQASSPDERLTIEVGEGQAACPEDRTFCLTLTGGLLDEIDPGDEVEVTFRNTGSTQHEVLVQALTPSNEAHTASEDDGVHAASERAIDAGGADTFTFTVPSHWEGIYLFCGVAGHEESGMWRSARFQARSPAPSPSAGAVLAALAGLALVVAARRRQG